MWLGEMVILKKELNLYSDSLCFMAWRSLSTFLIQNMLFAANLMVKKRDWGDSEQQPVRIEWKQKVLLIVAEPDNHIMFSGQFSGLIVA